MSLKKLYSVQVLRYINWLLFGGGELSILKNNQVRKIIWITIFFMYLVLLFPNTYFVSKGSVVQMGHEFILHIKKTQIDYKRVFYYWLLIAIPSGSIIVVVSQRNKEETNET